MKPLIGLLAPVLLLLSACGQNDNAKNTETATAEQPSVERGAYLVKGIMGCGHCHTPGSAEGAELGPELSGDIWDFGEFHNTVPNLTPDNETGIGTWSEDQIVHAIRTGEKPDGTRLSFFMPWQWYQHMSDYDAYSVAMYLKSIPAVHHEVPANPETGTVDDLKRPMPDMPPADPSDKVAYGRYLVGIGHCMECHTKNGDFEHGLGAGGFVFDLGQAVVVSTNITPDKTDGIGNWSVEDIEKLLKTGERPDGTHIFPLMPIEYFKNMTDADREAIALYLKTLKPLPSPINP